MAPTTARVALATAIALSCVAAQAAEVALKADGKAFRVRAPAYDAVVEENGCLTSLRVGGQEFLKAGVGNPRGAYLFQDGPLVLPTIERPAADVVTAKNDKASVRYDFGPDGVKWTVANTTAEKLLCLLVFDKAIGAVEGDNGWWEKPPTAFKWKQTTWFAGTANVKITGSSRVWGPWGDGLQVWEATVGPKETHDVTLQANAATAAEIAKAHEVATSPPPPPPADPVGPRWDMDKLSAPPAVFPAEGFSEEGVRAVFYEGPPFRGKPTRVFAWIGLPKVESGQKVPGMVLVHGGGGTAFASWVRLWVDRGYAAIAMDTCGCVPRGTSGNWDHHESGGPPGWGGWGQIDWPREDQWTYHAIADALLGHSLLRSLPEVDANRVGLTGISWGGYLTCLLAGVDPRYKLAMPVYGCGFTNEHTFAGSVNGQGEEGAARWMRWWDPSVYLPDAPMPLCWVTGSNDFAYTFNALQKSYRLPKSPRTLCIRLRMPHGHGAAGEGPKELEVFADSILKGGVPLAKVTGQGRDGAQVWATFESGVPVVKAELNYTKDTGKWPDRTWVALPAQLSEGKVTASLPEGTTVYYLNLFDERECVVSTEHDEIVQ
ncbi:MAG: hypothetical protein AUJ96_28095 [Armatimonadetes bacterium CG2_30_66_41]|nr:MAG: hypothetical protein AUJ96_28095 [Armatimonadetes bacterium CG2_30_66_41]